MLARRHRTPFLPLLLALPAFSCSPEYQLLETVAPLAGMAGAGATPSAGGGTLAEGGSGASELGGGGSAQAGTSVGGESEGGAAVTCSDASERCSAACTRGFLLTSSERNGCTTCECAPPSECERDADCAAGEVCYAGRHCADGCREPSCCFGNQCSPAGCQASTSSCLLFGCAGGGECFAACDETRCECDGASWLCQSTTGGDEAASCPQACAPP
jgi:hypothetical protein